MKETLFEQADRIGMWMPDEVAQRYHLAAGVEIEIVPTEEGILLRPLDVPPWFSVEWEHALETVIEWYGPALEAIVE